MPKRSRVPLLIVSTVLSVSGAYTLAEAPPPATEASVRLVLTVKGNGDSSGLNSDNLSISEGRDHAKVTDVLPSERVGLQLFIMMDNSRQLSYGTHVQDIRHFILTQPPTTKIGIVYMDMKGPNIVQDLTADHALAAQAVTTPLGTLANGESPYSSLSQLIDRWPATDDRREVLMISNGVDATYGEFGAGRQDAQDPYVDAAIEKAQRAGIVVFTIVTSNETVRLPETGPPNIPTTQNSLRDIGPTSVGLGKFYLGKVAEDTGGQLYYYKSSAPVSFAPYLADLTDRLRRQYVVTILVKPAKKPSLQAIKVRIQSPHIETVSAQRIYVPAQQ